MFTPTKTATQSDLPQNDPGEILLTTANTSKRPESPKTPTQRATSSRNIIDRPVGTSYSADKPLIDSFNVAMKNFKSISQTKNYMTLQSECEKQDRTRYLLKPTKAKISEEDNQKLPRLHLQRTIRTNQENKITYDVFIIEKKKGECYPYGYTRYLIELSTTKTSYIDC